MIGIIPASVLSAYRDRRLKRRDLIVYALALEQLSFIHLNQFKVRSVATDADMHYQHAAACIRRLVAFGYLERGPNDGYGRTYLLRSSPETKRAA